MWQAIATFFAYATSTVQGILGAVKPLNTETTLWRFQHSIVSLGENITLPQINLLKAGGAVTLDHNAHKTLTSNVVRSQRFYTPGTDSTTSFCARHTRYVNPCLPTKKRHL